MNITYMKLKLRKKKQQKSSKAPKSEEKRNKWDKQRH